MSGNEQDIQQLIARMNKQQQMMNNVHAPQQHPQMSHQQNEFEGSPDQSPHLMGNNNTSMSPDQSPVDAVNSVRPMGKPIAFTPRAELYKNETSVSEGGCPECGTIHPPLQPGQKCPMAPLKSKQGEEEKIVDVNKYLTDLKNIIISQAQMKNVQDYDKLFKNITIEITKFLEGYNE